MQSSIHAVQPLAAVEGGRLSITGESFPVDEERLPAVQVGAVPARVVRASSRALDVVVPAGVEGGRQPIRIDGVSGETAFVRIGTPIATGLHQVDRPAFAPDGSLYVTYSGSRDQQAPVSVYRVSPDGAVEPFSSVANPTSVVCDEAGRVFVSNRFEGVVYQLAADGTPTAFASDLGAPFGLAVDEDGALLVGDRTGTLYRVSAGGEATPFARLPASVAAFHLALAPDGWLYVSAPTLAPTDPIYRVSREGTVEPAVAGFGRPQGLAFDAAGCLHVVEALAGASGVYRVDEGRSPELALSGANLVGVTFAPSGGLVVASSETVFACDDA